MQTFTPYVLYEDVESALEFLSRAVAVEDVDAVYDRARAAGVEIIEELADQEYGGRRFGARDPEGHSWWFDQLVREVPPGEWGAVAT